MPDGIVRGNVFELGAFVRAPQHQTAAAHVSSSNEGKRKQQTLSEDVEERFEILWSRQTAEQHVLTSGARCLIHCARIPFERLAVSSLTGIDRYLRHRSQIGRRDEGSRCDQAPSWR